MTQRIEATGLSGLDALPAGITAETHGWGVLLTDPQKRRCASLQRSFSREGEGLFNLELFRFRLTRGARPICHDLATRPRWGRWDEQLGRAIAWIAVGDPLEA